MKKWIRHQFRKRSRVYILPTRMGGYLNGLIFLMFLLSIGYNNNLLLIFTLCLFGLNLLWVIQSHFHLHRLKLSHMSLPPGHAGEALPLSLYWKAAPQIPAVWDLELESGNEKVMVKSLSSTIESVLGEVVLPHRGRWDWNYLKISTELPFGLYRVWRFDPVELTTLAYPRLTKISFVPKLKGEHRDGQQFSGRKGPDDLLELSPYHSGQEARKISWKHYARKGDLLVKTGEELQDAIFRIKLQLPQNPEQCEEYLSLLATQMVQCHQRQIPFLFEHGSASLGPSTENVHLSECLKVLGLC